MDLSKVVMGDEVVDKKTITIRNVDPIMHQNIMDLKKIEDARRTKFGKSDYTVNGYFLELMYEAYMARCDKVFNGDKNGTNT